MKQSKNTRRGFSLIELLVVMAIIAVLASLLLPALAKAKQQGLRAKCVSNLRQTGLAFHLYLADYNDIFPAANGGRLPEDWIYYNEQSPGPVARSPIMIYLSGASTNVLMCPADQSLQSHPARMIGTYPFSYTLNDANAAVIRGIDLNPGMKLLQAPVVFTRPEFQIQGMASPYQFGPGNHFRQSMIASASSKIMLAESRHSPVIFSTSTGPQNVSFFDLSGSSWQPYDSVDASHGKKGMTCLADGHVEGFTPEEAVQPGRIFATSQSP